MNRECEEIMACRMCNNARIDDDLTDDNDASFIMSIAHFVQKNKKKWYDNIRIK